MADNQYFQDAIKKHGFTGKGKGGDADYLREDFNKQTQGLDKDVAMEAMQGGRMFGASDKARYDKLMADRASAKDKAQTFAAGSAGSGSGSNSNIQEDIGNTSQEVTQDNDQTSTITGDNNYSYQSQDNSVRNYGGDARVFNYQGSGNPMTDTPASAGTMAGFFAPDDSPAANAARLDRQSTQNRDLQKKYADTSHIAQGAISRANQNAYTDPAALDKRIGQREQYNNAKSDVTRAQLFGDMGNFQSGQWNDAKPQEKTEMPDYEEMYKKYSKF